MLHLCKDCGWEWFQSLNTIKGKIQCPKCKSFNIAEEYTREYYVLKDSATIIKEKSNVR